jgi:hypothetical protein
MKRIGQTPLTRKDRIMSMEILLGNLPKLSDRELRMCVLDAGSMTETPGLREYRNALTAESKRRERNAVRRAMNNILREVCGTSARAAREDMGM